MVDKNNNWRSKNFLKNNTSEKNDNIINESKDKIILSNMILIIIMKHLKSQKE